MTMKRRSFKNKRRVHWHGRVVYFRILRQLFFRWTRFFVYFCFRLWIKRIHNQSGFPFRGPAIIVSNHTSYFDWAILSAIYWDRYLVFIGNKDLLNRGFVGWLTKLNILIFIDPIKPSVSAYREALDRLDAKHILVVYPEGTRSKSGRMLEPKTGFIKLAMRTGAPLIPIGMKGTYDILPPHKSVPQLKRCEIVVGSPISVEQKNPLFNDLFEMRGEQMVMNEVNERVAAVRVMEIIRKMTGQNWDNLSMHSYV